MLESNLAAKRSVSCVTISSRITLVDVCLRHLACVGAGIIILMQGFETFSQQMVTFEETPTPQFNDTNSFAPPPARSETWHNVIFKGVGGGEHTQYCPSYSCHVVELVVDLDLGLSTKASFYDGIMASSLSELPVFCGTANCTWPTFENSSD